MFLKTCAYCCYKLRFAETYAKKGREACPYGVRVTVIPPFEKDVRVGQRMDVQLQTWGREVDIVLRYQASSVKTRPDSENETESKAVPNSASRLALTRFKNKLMVPRMAS